MSNLHILAHFPTFNSESLKSLSGSPLILARIELPEFLSQPTRGLERAPKLNTEEVGTPEPFTEPMELYSASQLSQLSIKIPASPILTGQVVSTSGFTWWWSYVIPNLQWTSKMDSWFALTWCNSLTHDFFVFHPACAGRWLHPRSSRRPLSMYKRPVAHSFCRLLGKKPTWVMVAMSAQKGLC